MPTKVVPASNNKAPPKLRLKIANECDNLLKRSKITTLNRSFKFHFVSSTMIDDTWTQRLMALIEANMKAMYERSSWGWNYEEKLSEITKSTTKLVLITTTSCDDPDNICDKLPDEQLDKDREFVGFMSYRFEVGADKSECALYVYEVHIDNKYQGMGLGKELMKFAKCLAQTFKMDKIMLTVFNFNIQALNFYKKLRFQPDKSTPSKSEADYVILGHSIK